MRTLVETFFQPLFVYPSMIVARKRFASTLVDGNVHRPRTTGAGLGLFVGDEFSSTGNLITSGAASAAVIPILDVRRATRSFLNGDIQNSEQNLACICQSIFEDMRLGGHGRITRI